MCICMYIYIYIDVCMYIYIYIHTIITSITIINVASEVHKQGHMMTGLGVET